MVSAKGWDDRAKVILLNLPSPPHTNVYRDYAGSLGLATPSRRTRHGHDIHVIPPLFDAYATAILEKEGVEASILYARTQNVENIDSNLLLENYHFKENHLSTT